MMTLACLMFGTPFHVERPPVMTKFNIVFRLKGIVIWFRKVSSPSIILSEAIFVERKLQVKS